jgi:hypothetical protein
MPLVVLIVGQLTSQPEPENDATGDGNGQAGDVDQGVHFIAVEIPECYFKEAGKQLGPPLLAFCDPQIAQIFAD